MEEKIYIFDTTLRDGEQSPGASMNLEEKLKLARQLEALQVDVMEAGFPIASDGDFESVRQIAKEVRGSQYRGIGTRHGTGYSPCLGSTRNSCQAAHPYLHRNVRYSSSVQVEAKPRAGA